MSLFTFGVSLSSKDHQQGLKMHRQCHEHFLVNAAKRPEAQRKWLRLSAIRKRMGIGIRVASSPSMRLNGWRRVLAEREQQLD
jgi:hypothetical protein